MSVKINFIMKNTTFTSGFTFVIWKANGFDSQFGLDGKINGFN